MVGLTKAQRAEKAKAKENQKRQLGLMKYHACCRREKCGKRKLSEAKKDLRASKLEAIEKDINKMGQTVKKIKKEVKAAKTKLKLGERKTKKTT